MNVSLLEDKADNLQLMAARICLMTVVGRDHSYIEKSIHRLYIYIYIYIYIMRGKNDTTTYPYLFTTAPVKDATSA